MGDLNEDGVGGERLPTLSVRGPRGEELTVELLEERATIGRLPDLNTVVLEPDPQQLVSRHAHCLVERQEGVWWVVDNGSVNRTFLARAGDGEMEVVEGRAQLTDGDVISVLGLLTEEGQPVYWQLRFADPLQTRPAPFAGPPTSACIAYDWPQAKLFVIESGARREIALRPQEHKLVRYMAQRNAANDGVPVLCTHDDLLGAVWEGEPYHVREELARLVWELRRKLGDEPAAPQLIETERGLGYRLRTCPGQPRIGG